MNSVENYLRYALPGLFVVCVLLALFGTGLERAMYLMGAVIVALVTYNEKRSSQEMDSLKEKLDDISYLLETQKEQVNSTFVALEGKMEERVSAVEDGIAVKIEELADTFEVVSKNLEERINFTASVAQKNKELSITQEGAEASDSEPPHSRMGGNVLTMVVVLLAMVFALYSFSGITHFRQQLALIQSSMQKTNTEQRQIRSVISKTNEMADSVKIMLVQAMDEIKKSQDSVSTLAEDIKKVYRVSPTTRGPRAGLKPREIKRAGPPITAPSGIQRRGKSESFTSYLR